MTLTPLWRTRLFAAGAAIVAIVLGVNIANGNYLLPGAAAVVLAGVLVAHCQPIPLPTLVLGAAMAGYILGNRGFAQISLAGRVPLLPAEAALLFAGPILLVQCAWRHELPFRRDPLNLAILAWIVTGSLRIVFDFRAFGFMAVRDFAMVYYAAFFFIAQEAAREVIERRFLLNVLLGSCLLLLPIFLLYGAFPNVFLGQLVFRGNPLIFFKGDLAGMFLAIGAVLLFLKYESSGRIWSAIASLAWATAAIATNSRATMLGLMLAAVWLAARRRWRFLVMLAGSGVLASVAILAGALVLRISWEKTPLFGVYERVVSIVDPMGQRAYRGADTHFKGDNNLFRAVWWRAVIDETIEGDPYLGLGFGHDIAARFIREYYPESGDDFSTRSPHNVLLSIFARMGAVGLLLFLIILTITAVKTSRAISRSAAEGGPWCAVWIMVTCACFGVVLEGPMGAVVFWSVLGVAHASSEQEHATAAPEGSEEAIAQPPRRLNLIERP